MANSVAGSKIGGVPKTNVMKIFQMVCAYANESKETKQEFLRFVQKLAMIVTMTESDECWTGLRKLMDKYHAITCRSGFEPVDVIKSNQYNQTISNYMNEIHSLGRLLRKEKAEIASKNDEITRLTGSLTGQMSQSSSPPPAGGPPAPGGGPPAPSGGPPAPGGGPPAPGGGPPAPGSGPPAPGGGPPAGRPKVNRRLPSKKMKQVNWRKLPAAKLESTVWKDTKDTEVDLKFEELENMFQAKVIKPKKASAEQKPKKAVAVTLLDPSRSNNISIMLQSCFRDVDIKTIKQWIVDVNMEKIGPNIEQLSHFVPTAEEISTLEQYDDKNNLTKADQYFLAVKDIPRLGARLNAMQYVSQFGLNFTNVLVQIKSVQNACKEMKANKSFVKILEIILAIGNFLNGSGVRGNAVGFKLETLLKLKDTKSTDNSTTLLSYIVSYISAKDKTLLDWAKQMPNIASAVRANKQMIQSTVQKLKLGLSQIKSVLDADGGQQGQFHAKMSKFYETAAPKVERLGAEFELMEKSFAELMTLYAENANTTSPEEFFGKVCRFSADFDAIVAEREKEAMSAARKARLAKARAKNPALRKKPGLAASTGGPPQIDFGAVVGQLKAGGFANRRKKISQSKIGGRKRMPNLAASAAPKRSVRDRFAKYT
eukprot:TRINITY_DN3474_c0_g1_i2.p1 TRINITY_DN3474_c0_g1~~TRINITY_DN3474_c0_g1_i2.p1  ORF type:complete len:719 (+),score=143.86 TRINITY_DN3474_c0_g1_i2:196-2157(+)